MNPNIDTPAPSRGGFSITCPLSRPSRLAVMRRDRPGLFDRACHLETLLNQRRAALGKDPVWLTRFAQPLATAIPPAQPTLPDTDEDSTAGVDDDAGCDNGTCFT